MSWSDAAGHGDAARRADEQGMSAFDRLVLPRGAVGRPARRRVPSPPDGRDLEPTGQPGGDSGGGCPEHCRPMCHPAECPDLRSTERRDHVRVPGSAFVHALPVGAYVKVRGITYRVFHYDAQSDTYTLVLPYDF